MKKGKELSQKLRIMKKKVREKLKKKQWKSQWKQKKGVQK